MVFPPAIDLKLTLLSSVNCPASSLLPAVPAHQPRGWRSLSPLPRPVPGPVASLPPPGPSYVAPAFDAGRPELVRLYAVVRGLYAFRTRLVRTGGRPVCVRSYAKSRGAVGKSGLFFSASEAARGPLYHGQGGGKGPRRPWFESPGPQTPGNAPGVSNFLQSCFFGFFWFD